MRRISARAAVAILAIATALLRTEASVPGLEESVEFHFAGGPATHWRIERNLLQRFAPAAESTLHLVSPSGKREAWSGDRLVLGLRAGAPFPAESLAALRLTVARRVGDRLWILQAPDAWSAASAAHALAGTAGIEVAAPVLQRKAAMHGPFAPRPDDPYFTEQWHLENRDPLGVPFGPDTNPRAAWAMTRAAGITIAICDSGFDTNHPDLKPASTGAPHYDFTRNREGAAMNSPHATCVAGLAGATGDNGVGVTGLAPAARLLSLTIFDSRDQIVSEERLMDMYQYRSNLVHVQNHSWGNADTPLFIPSPLENTGVSNAITLGRGGRGVVMVRSAGNYRDVSVNVNDDGAANDPRVIAVAAVRRDGRAASYSNPGACVLVAAPSGDEDDPFSPTETIFTTDQVGTRGYNTSTSSAKRPDYAFGNTGFSGTSAAVPQISGIAALIVAANTNLTYRDVQQVLIHSARHYDGTDPFLHRNAAGYWVSDNQGFGIPDAGQAVKIAGAWSNRPPLSTLSIRTNVSLVVPDDGLHLIVVGADGVQRSIQCMPSLGPHADDPTPLFPLVSVGKATNEIAEDLHGKAALVERGPNVFREKLEIIGRSGAEFAVIFNNLGFDEIFVPGGTDFAPIPAVMISENEGRALLARLNSGEQVSTRLNLQGVQQQFIVTNTLACEHVGLRVRSNHGRRGDLRITLTSPSGTRSVLQRLNEDIEAGPEDWTYWSVQHFYESSAGTWTAAFADETNSVTGTITEVELIIRGVPITDTDHDGLDDAWEMRWFGSLAQGPTDDPDGDGSHNAREQALVTDPTRSDEPLRLDLAVYDEGEHLRLSWPGTDSREYRLLGAPSMGVAGSEVAKVPGRFPETEWIVPRVSGTNLFFWLEVTGN